MAVRQTVGGFGLGQSSRVGLAVLLLAWACVESNDAGSCPDGSEGCPCYRNGSCDSGLECRSNLCVEASDPAQTGGTSATGGESAATGGDGAEDTGGSSGATGEGGVSTSGGRGGSSGGQGGTSADTGGSPEEAGASSGGASSGGASSGGASSGGAETTGGTTAGGAGACVDTSSDWQNCGVCGRVCENAGVCPRDVPCCASGDCAPTWGPCFEVGEFSSCNEACESIGETCVTRGCGRPTTSAYTWMGFDADNPECSRDTPSDIRTDECIALLTELPAGAVRLRCCCSDSAD